jgi:hypothetical protein
MDPEANIKEQERIANEINHINDRCAPDGSFSEEQMLRLSELACELAELVLALIEWNSKQQPKIRFVLKQIRIFHGDEHVATIPHDADMKPVAVPRDIWHEILRFMLRTEQTHLVYNGWSFTKDQ